MKKVLLLFVLLMVCALQIIAQSRTITGTVTDKSSGEPLVGAAVLVQGTTLGVTTDFDGKYTIIVSDKSKVLEFSSVSYKKQTVAIDGSTNVIDVQLEEDRLLLDQVVVTALGIPKAQKSVGYATQEVDGAGLVKARESNVINALNGKVAGVQITNSSGSVGSSSRIILRGAASITGTTDPLFVVDGVPIDNGNYGNAGDGGGFDLPNGVADLNPDDIATMTVLKGPNAAALYGVRAANGVIVITTKKGKPGTKGLGISLNSSTTFERPLVLPDFQNSYGQGPDPNFFYWVNGQSDDGGVDESWGPPLDAGLEFTQWNSYTVDGKPLPWISRPNNIRNFYETGVTANNNLSFAGATNNMGYRLSLGLMNQKGMIPNTDYKKYNIGGNTDFNVSSRLKLGLSVNYTKAQSGNLPTGGYDNENPVQQMIWSGRNVDFEALKDYQNLPLAPVGTAAEGTPINWNNIFQNNPYWALHTNLNKLDKDRIIGNVNASYKITSFLTLSAKTGTDHWSSMITEQKAKGSNAYPEGFYRETSRFYTETNSDVLLSLNKDLTKDVGLSASVGANRMDRRYRILSGEASQLELPAVYNLSNVKAGTSPILINRIENSRINSIYGTAQIALKNAIYLDLTGRNDWSSMLPPENNSFFYPSATLSVVLTDLLKMNSKVLPYLKLRAGWAKVGNTGALAPYSLQQAFDFRDAPYGSLGLVYNPAQLNNPNLVSEGTKGTEFGLDARFLDNRLRIDVTYYNQKSNDLIVPVEVSAASGYITALQNVGVMSNKGIELQLGATLVKTKDVTFEAILNWAKNKNEVVSLGGLDALNLGGQWNVSLQAREGMPYGVLFGPGYLRAPDGQIIHKDGIPQIDPNYKILGDIQPDWTGGVTLNLKYKFISLNTIIDGKKGGSIYSMTTTWGRYSGVLEETLLGRETGLVGDGVKNIGTADAPEYVTNDIVVRAETYNKAAYANSVAEGSVFDASFVKLRQIMVGFDLPNKWFSKTIFQGASISLVGRNLAILHRNAPHIDPETGFSSKNSEQGQEFGQLPSARSIGFNLNFNF